MNFAMIVFLFSLMMPQEPAMVGAPFPTLEACQAEAAKMPALIAQHNAGPNPVKIHFYAVECVPLKLAPSGTGV